MRIAALVIVGALAGCGSHGQDADPQPVSDVVGKIRTTCHQAEGDVDMPFRSSGIAAYVADGTSGYHLITGTGADDGSFAIPDVPEHTPYMLRVGTRYFVTDQHALDLQFEQQGRCVPMASVGASAATVAIDLSNASEFRPATDSLRLESPRLGVGGPSTRSVTGATELQGSISWPAGLALPDAAAGDDLYVVHTRLDKGTDAATGAAVAQLSILDWFDAIGTSLQDRAATSITGALTSPASAPGLSHGGTLAIDHTLFEAAFAAEAAPRSFTVRVTAEVGTGVAVAGGDLSVSVAGTVFGVEIDPPQMSRIDGTTSTDYSYADPFPAAWRRVLSVDRLGFRYVTLTSSPALIGIGTGYHEQTEYSGEFHISPAVDPPTHITVAGVDFAQGGKVAFNGRSPVAVRWDPVAGAQLYELAMTHITTSPPGIATSTVTTADTSLELPAEIFEPATSYVFRFTAIQTPTDYRAGHLLPATLPMAAAGTVSGRFRFLVDCGDGRVQSGEDCDTAGESASCNADCTGAVCGDGVVNRHAGEQCDAHNDFLHCTSDCKLP